MEGAFAKPTEQVLASFGVHATNGLSDDQVVALRAKHGKNCELSPAYGPPSLAQY
jgi:Ca2+ transporting ATPase